jgi:ubiquinone/menaquinone biosynthesis C-methylase UbiE
MPMLAKRDVCRLCDSSDVALIYKMPACPPVDNFRLPGSPEISLPKFPMDLYACRSCGHAQLLDVVDPEILYGNYIYTSSSSSDLDRHFSAYAKQVAGSLGLSAIARVLDVGSNDGLLLSKFKDLGMAVVGLDPSSFAALKAAEKGINTHVDYLNHASVNKLLADVGRFDVVTANNVFSHADNLREFAECVRDLLSEDGAFVFEVSYLKDLLDNLVIDYVYHEHLCHHSIKPLRQFLGSCGMKLINVERIKTKGGSIRCYAVKTNNPAVVQPVVEQMIAEEIAAGIYDAASYQALQHRIDAIASDLRVMLEGVIRQGGKIAAYGASATTTVLNALLGIEPFISFIVDDNESRQNRLSPGFMIPVLSSAALKTYKPVCVVLSAWRFADEIIKRNQPYLAAGGRFIVPLPHIREIQ